MFTKIYTTIVAISLVLTNLAVNSAFAVTDADLVPKEASIIEKLGDTVDPEIVFRNEQGEQVKIGDYLNKGLPILLTPVYYGCPGLCTYTLNGVLDLLDELELQVGKDFTILSFSINSKETPKLAAEKKEVYVSKLDDRHNGKSGWHFLTGAEDQVQALTKAVGFQFFPDKNEFAHAAAIMVLTEQGVVSRYLYGIVFPEDQVRLSLVEASEGKIGSTFDHIYLYCFSFDPTKGQYTLAIMNIVRVVSVGFLVILVFVLWRVYKKSEANR